MLSKIISTVLVLQFSVGRVIAQECAFNQPRERNAKIGGFQQVPYQGHVENFSGVIQTARSKAATLSWGRCPKPTPQETLALSEAEKGSGYSLHNVKNVDELSKYTESQLEDIQEELIFLSAARNIHEFSLCQKGLYDSYFENKDKKTEMLDRSYSQFRNIKPKVLELFTKMAPFENKVSLSTSFKSCLKDSCAGRVNTKVVEAIRTGDQTSKSLQDLETSLTSLLGSIPMGNRDEMRRSLRLLYRTNPNASKAQFTETFDGVMVKMKTQVDKTIGTFSSIKRSNDGKDFFCIDTVMKQQLYRSGQVSAINQKTGLTGPECRMGTRYGVEGELITELLLIPTYFLGYGLARLALRMSAAGTEVVALAGRGTTVVSNLALLGIQSTDIALFTQSAVDACVKNSFLTGMRGKTCNPENEMALAYEEASVSQCIANIAIYGMTNAVALGAVKRVSEVSSTTAPSTINQVPEKVKYGSILEKAAPNQRTATSNALLVLEKGSSAQSAAETYKKFQKNFRLIRENSKDDDLESQALLAKYILKQRKAGASDETIQKNIDEAFDKVCR